jgi:DNA (cytosine-5)-methyltransferase 1
VRMLSLCSGIDGIGLAAKWAGIETVAFCEIEPFPQKVLRKRFPGKPIFDDLRKLNRQKLIEAGVITDDGSRTIDLICAGYPCQPFSHAGKRLGEEDDRHLWPEVFRLVRELRPPWFLGENVAGHVTLGLDSVLADLDSAGYTARAFLLPAAAVGAPHRRDRVFIVAHAGYEQPPRRNEIA